MVTRARCSRVVFGLSLRIGALAMCCTPGVACDVHVEERPALLLAGIAIVDVEAGLVRQADVLMIDGKVSAVTDASQESDRPRPGVGQHVREVDGRGHWLLPAFWDVRARLWGNASTKKLSHYLGVTNSLRNQLYYGVAHVRASGLQRRQADREMVRSAALELAAAELVYSELSFCDSDDPSICRHPSEPAAVSALLDELQNGGVYSLELSFNRPDSKPLPGLTPDVLEATLRAAAGRGMPCLVSVDTWERAEQAIALGARALYGLPLGRLSEALIERMQREAVVFAPALSGYLEGARLLGNLAALNEPFLAASVPRNILATFEDPSQLGPDLDSFLADLELRRQTALDDVSRLARAGVQLLTATDAGWAPGAFQGYSAHATQAWLERAGIDVWSRLRALSVWPAAFMGRRAGFQVGDPADFVALEQDPLADARALRSISFLVRHGEYVERSSLAPDVSRERFSP